ncbi:Glutamate-gated chloride channel-like 3 [Homarus americanus]|uniref:Glutamate-gated chloride channel-like 3 n=1 Tax=Homarus americanus TaxID=6706 RepID=A0A8J5KJ51_HOMAM|nr:Glutamate-gated chloride channel-like 3 [Homarus americanus]
MMWVVWVWSAFSATSLAQVPTGVQDADIITSSEVPAVGRDEVLVLALQESGVPSSHSYASLLTPFPKLMSFTVCYRLLLGRFREESTLMSYAVADDKDNEIRIDHQLTSYKVAVHSIWAKTAVETPLRYWTHFCFTYHYTSGKWQVFVNGQPRAQGTLPPVLEPLRANGSYIIEGEAMAWSLQQWKLNGDVRWRVRSLSEVCDTSTRMLVIFPDRFTLTAAIHFCQVVGGQVAVPLSSEENTRVYEASSSMAENCSGGQGASFMWLGAHDQLREGQWITWGSGQRLTWEGPWRGAGPNGGTSENCLVMLSGKYPAHWSDITCLDSYRFCMTCEFSRRSTLHMKGAALCDGSPFNTLYFLNQNASDRPHLAGFLHSVINWNPDTHSWLLTSLKVEGAMASWTPAKEGMYPFGTNNWVLGSEVCGMSPGTTVPLTISVCGIGQFTCADGSCIELWQRCDLRVDCPDQSDESSCSLVEVPQGYSTTIPPPPLSHSHTLPITFFAEIMAFPSIITQDLTMMATFKLALRWRDVRLNFLNLKEDLSLNLLTEESVAAIWTPRVFFSNAQGNVFTNLEQGARVEGVREGPSRPSPTHYPVEVNIFSGHENSLEMSQLYTVTYTCEFQLAKFPFDSQVCSLSFRLVSASASYLSLVPVNVTYSGEFSAVRVSVRFSRRYEFYVLTLYIPTALPSSFTAYTTFYFNPTIFQPRIVVALTALLVLSSLFSQTSNSLPKTSYFKLVDVWLFFSVVIIFVMIVLQTLVEFCSLDTVFHFRRKNVVIQMKPTTGNQNTGEPRMSLSLAIFLSGRILIPVIVLLFNFIYWGKALT